MDGKIGSRAEIGRRRGLARERERQAASDPRYGFPQSLGPIGGANIWLRPEGVWWAERRAVWGLSCRG
jgi:hypothetical protein